MRIASLLAVLFAAAVSLAQARPTPAPEDVPVAVPGPVSLAGATCPDITRYLNVRGPSSPQLSPDGSKLSYHSSVSGQPQLWVMNVREGGTWPQQITFGESVTFSEWSPAGDWIVYGTDRSGNEREGFYLINSDGTKERELLPPSESFRAWGGFSADGAKAAFAATEAGKNDFHIYVVDVASGNVKRVAETKGGTYIARWRPDGKGLVLTRTRGEDANDLLYLDLESGAVTTLFEPKVAASYSEIAWLPDSSGFYLATNEDRDFENLAFYDFAKKQLRWIESPSRDVEGVALSPDGRFLLWKENDGGFSVVKLRELAGGTTRTIDLPRGVATNIVWAGRAPRFAILMSRPSGIDLWVGDTSSAKPVRVAGASMAGLDPSSFADAESVSFPSFDGETIHGILYMPRGASADRRPPVILSVHGGPTSQARPSFSGIAQYFLARGYALLDLNFRGSTGYGKRFTRLDNGRLRPNAVKDMQAAVDWLRKSRPVDASRVAVTGGSYGGYMTFAALSQLPDTFKAGIGFVGVSNWITALEGASPQLKASDRIEYGNIDDPADREFFKELSPLTHVANVKAPLMVSHGANDPRDPVGEADQFVRAIRERGGVVEYLRFPDEGHGIRKMSNRIIAYRRMAAFLEKTLGRGIATCE